MVNLDDHYGDLQNVIFGRLKGRAKKLTSDMEIEWVQRMIERLEPIEGDLMCLADAIAEVDW